MREAMSELFAWLETRSPLEARTLMLNFVPIEPVTEPLFNGLIFSSIFCLVIACVAVSLRLYTRVYLRPIAGWDDWTAFLSLLTFAGYEACVLVVAYTIKPNTAVISAHVMTLSTNLMLAAESLYVWCMIFVKISLGIFFLRIVSEQWQRRVIYVMMSLSTLVGIAYFFWALFQCGIPNGNGISEWETRLNGECATTPPIARGISYTHGVINMLTDISFLAIVLPMISGAKMPNREKRIVFGIFGVAVCGCAASAARLAFVNSLSNNTTSFWVQIIYLAITASVECGMSITAMSAATLRPLLRQIYSWLQSSTSSFHLSTRKKSSKGSSDSGTSLRQQSGSSPAPTSQESSMASKKSKVKQTFLFDTMNSTTMNSSTMNSSTMNNSTMNSTNGGKNQSETFFLESMSSMNRETEQTPGGYNIDSLAPLTEEPYYNNNNNGGHDLEKMENESYLPNRANRATWWPLPQEKLLED